LLWVDKATQVTLRKQAQYSRARLSTRRARFITTSIHVVLH